MAKLSARGRTEQLRLEQPAVLTPPAAGDRNGGFRQRAYMSDGVILARVRVGANSRDTTIWTVCGRVKPDLSPRRIAELRARGGWFPVLNDRRRTPRSPESLAVFPIVTTAQAQRRTRARARAAERKAERLAVAQTRARALTAPDTLARLVTTSAGHIHVAEPLRYWVRATMGRLTGGIATFRLMPRDTRKALIRMVADRRTQARATYKAVMGRGPYPTERMIGAQILRRAR